MAEHESTELPDGPADWLLAELAPDADSDGGERVCLFRDPNQSVAEFCARIRRGLASHHLVFHPFLTESRVQDELLQEGSRARQILGIGFHRVIVLDIGCAVNERGEFDLAVFYEYAFAQLTHAFGLPLTLQYHEQDMVQILRDMPKSLICLLNMHLTSKHERQHLRSLMQEEHQALIVYRRDGDSWKSGLEETDALGEGTGAPGDAASGHRGSELGLAPEPTPQPAVSADDNLDRLLALLGEGTGAPGDAASGVPGEADEGAPTLRDSESVLEDGREATSGADDTGINLNLLSTSDSSLNLEDVPLDLAAFSVSSLELPNDEEDEEEDDDDEEEEEEDDDDDDEWHLEDEEDEGSQVIALDDSAAFAPKAGRDESEAVQTAATDPDDSVHRTSLGGSDDLASPPRHVPESPPAAGSGMPNFNELAWDDVARRLTVVVAAADNLKAAGLDALAQPLSRQADQMVRELESQHPESDLAWYVRPRGGGRYGPASGAMLLEWLAEGRVTPDCLVWRLGWNSWRTAGQAFFGLEPAPSQVPESNVRLQRLEEVVGRLHESVAMMQRHLGLPPSDRGESQSGPDAVSPPESADAPSVPPRRAVEPPPLVSPPPRVEIAHPAQKRNEYE